MTVCAADSQSPATARPSTSPHATRNGAEAHDRPPDRDRSSRRRRRDRGGRAPATRQAASPSRGPRKRPPPTSRGRRRRCRPRNRTSRATSAPTTAGTAAIVAALRRHRHARSGPAKRNDHSDTRSQARPSTTYMNRYCGESTTSNDAPVFRTANRNPAQATSRPIALTPTGRCRSVWTRDRRNSQTARGPGRSRCWRS